MSIYITRKMVRSASEMRGADESKGLFRRMLDAGIRSRQRRRMIAALEALDDRILRDIGINRGDIPRVVYGFDDRELRMAPLGSTKSSAAAKHEAYRNAA